MDLVLDGGSFGRWVLFCLGFFFVGCFVVFLVFFFKYNLMKEEIGECSLKKVTPYARLFKQ